MLLKLQAQPQILLCSLSSFCRPSAWHAASQFIPQQLVHLQSFRQRESTWPTRRRVASTEVANEPVLDEREVEGMSRFLDSLKWDAKGLVAVIVQVSPQYTSSIRS